MQIVRNLQVLQQSMPSAALEEWGTACKRKGRDFALFNIPQIAKQELFMPVDNEPKHGAWQSRFAAIWQKKRQPTSMK
jgi:hypothetical protein